MRMEHWWFTAPLRLKSILRGRRVERELDEEMQFHLDHKIEEGIASGLSPRAARFAALRAMDGLEQRKEEMRDMRRIHWLTDFVDDASYAIRNLRRTIGLTAFVVITLGLGIGMSAAVFSMLDGLIFRPYPVSHPGRVVSLVSTSRDRSADDFSFREYLDIRGGTRSYDGVIASGDIQAVGFSAEPGATPRVKAGALVSGNYFRVLGVEPQLGRGFRDDEDEVPGRNAVVVLGPDFWKHEFAGDPSVVGRTVRLNGADFVVIGVAPDAFPGMEIFQRPDFYMPLAMARRFATTQKSFFEDRDDRELTVRARLKAGMTVQQARSELAVIAQRFERDYPKLNHDRGAAALTQFEMRTRADAYEWKFIVIFAVLALAVLLVACTNVAGLLLSRAQTRTREIAVRLALGAGRFRLIRMLLTESLMLASLGGLAGVAIAYGAIRFFLSLAIPAELPVTLPFQLDRRVLLANLALSVLSAIACGLAPALQSTRADLVNGLKSADADAAAGTGRRRLWGRNVLVVAQVSMSLLLLTASFLVMRGFHNGVAPTTGFVKDHLLLSRFDPRLVQYDPAQTQQFYKLLAERARATPGVQSAGLTQNPPLGLEPFGRLAFVPDGFQLPRDRENFTAMMDTVDEGFFRDHGDHDSARPRRAGIRYRGRAAGRGRERTVRDTLLAQRRRRGPAHPARQPHRRADRSDRRRADDHLSADLRKADGLRVSAAGAASVGAHRPAAAIERRSPSIDRAAERRRSVARRELADFADQNLRGRLPLLRRGRAGRRDTPRRDDGRGGGGAGHFRLVRTRGLQREPQNPRDRHSHRHRRGAVRRAAPGHGQGADAGGNGNGDRVGDGSGARAGDERHAVQCRRSRHRGVRRHRAVVVAGDAAGDLCARATSIQDCANTGAAIRVVRFVRERQADRPRQSRRRA